jgi:hypothetical protein
MEAVRGNIKGLAAQFPPGFGPPVFYIPLPGWFMGYRFKGSPPPAGYAVIVFPSFLKRFLSYRSISYDVVLFNMSLFVLIKFCSRVNLFCYVMFDFVVFFGRSFETRHCHSPAAGLYSFHGIVPLDRGGCGSTTADQEIHRL